eukprot:3050701-Pyramimonas_sp.AAC.1
MRLCRAPLLRWSTELRLAPTPLRERVAAAAARRELSSAEGKALAPGDLGRGAKRGVGMGGRPQGKKI